ncbi:MAG: pseudaminic acid cytidylyltransferase [Cyclobacteriaceae bacterium]|nr:pseudaminic acid cytidylyltransferase [Cyclobacteriaceae bacterium]
MNTSAICIIPARGGSKRIPGKNIRDFKGKPIIEYSIQTALRSGLFDEVMVSTDDEEIAGIALKAGAQVPFMRSAENSDDFATTVEVLIEVIGKYEASGSDFKYGCCIYPAAPLIKTERLKEGLGLLADKNCDSVFPVVAYSYPIWRGLQFDASDMVKMIWPENLNKRSQDMELAYHDAGQWYWFDVSRLLLNQRLFTDYSAGLVLDEYEVQDIDNYSDWQLAEWKYELLQNTR